MGDEHHDAVGYGKPPRHTRFQKGQSGNPGGRPTVNKTLAQAVGDELSEAVKLTGKRKRVTKNQIIANKLVHKAANGHIPSIAMIDKIMSRAKPDELEEREIVVTLDFEEPPPQRPDFTEVLELKMEITPDLVSEEDREAYRLWKKVMQRHGR